MNQHRMTISRVTWKRDKERGDHLVISSIDLLDHFSLNDTLLFQRVVHPKVAQSLKNKRTVLDL